MVTIQDYLKASELDQRLALKRAQGLSDEYETWVMESESKKSNPDERLPGIHASELSSECLRKVVYSLLATKQTRKLERRWQRRFMTGHALHDMLQKSFHRWAESTGHRIQFIDEVKIAPHLQENAALWDIQSSSDGIFSIRDAKTSLEVMRVMIEIKTISKAEFDKLKKPKPEHIQQAHLYMACLNVPFIWFIYWCKDDQSWTDSKHPEFLIPFDYEIWSKLEERMAEAHAFANQKLLPDRVEGMTCEFCGYKETCRPDYVYKPRATKPLVHLASLKGRR